MMIKKKKKSLYLMHKTNHKVKTNLTFTLKNMFTN